MRVWFYGSSVCLLHLKIIGTRKRCTWLACIAAYVDSNSEDSDSDVSDVGELDSDLEGEKQLRYQRDIYRDDVRALRKNLRADMAPGEKRNRAPDHGLQLQFVHGYDTR